MTAPAGSADAVRAVSVIAFAVGPERVVDRTLRVAIEQAAHGGELIVVHDRDEDAARARLTGYPIERPVRFVAGHSKSPGASRNAGVRSSTCECFLVIDGGESLPSDYAFNAQRALAAAPDASFAAAPGGPLFGRVNTGRPSDGRIDAASLVGSPWSIGPAIVRRQAFDDVGGFDDSLPALVDWDFLLTLWEAGKTGVMLTGSGARHADDDVRLRESMRPQYHLPAVRSIFVRHRSTFQQHMRTALVERERTAKALFECERQLLERRSRTMADLRAARDQLEALKPALDQRGLRAVDFADLRRTTPLSRNWGSERGLPIDRHYIHRFIAEHAQDVHGQVIEVLGDELTTTYGQDRVHRSDVLDIDAGNARATLIADLRVAEQLPADTYDCFILTQTLHLIDDMSAALRNAYRLLKPGGVLLATLPCASMVATEYGPTGDHWRVTEAGARTLFERVFRAADVEIRAHGNVLTLAAFLYGLCCEDLDPQELASDDPAYPLLITVRARKPPPVAGFTGRASRPAAAVLRYHRVANVTRDIHGLAISPRSFRSQIEQLCESWHILPLRALAATVANGEPPERAIALTFDDGYLDNLEIAAPILAELGVPATFFLSSEPLGVSRRFWWDALEEVLLGIDGCPETLEVRIRGERRSFQTSDLSARQAAHRELYRIFKSSAPSVRDDMLMQLARQTSVSLTSEAHRPLLGPEVRRLQAFPLIEVGAHGVHHRSLAQLSPEDCHREVFESRSALERLTGQPVTTFAYPFGDLSRDAVTTVMAAGFHAAVSCEARGLRAREHPLRIPRLPTCEESGSELGARLARMLRPSPVP